MTNTSSSSASRTWFITGATSGIGHELLQQAIAAGENVVAVARDVSSFAGEAGPHLLAVAADVRDEAAIKAAVDAGVRKFGRLDVIANNAGYGLFGAVEESTDEQARAIFDTNVFGTLNVIRATLPVLRTQGSGHILEGSSFFGQISQPGVGLLSATKYAVEGIADALADEVGPLGIKVTIVQPGMTATPFLSNLKAAENTYSDYDQTVRVVAEAIGALPADSFASAERVAAGIRTAIESAQPPRRLALNGAGAQAMKAGLEARLRDIDEWSSIAHTVDAA
ncbi:SDR family NAD(P)-dependent oxidoreductase [Kribbella sp. NBC_00382]|uniref:SDR family NAD(P)-dependent oxidoreductase n=1 Tax=Kribbella sp. NBC_00382 TaxID=2975967 RepID=UPI002E23816E